MTYNSLKMVYYTLYNIYKPQIVWNYNLLQPLGLAF